MRITDEITAYILRIMEESPGGTAELQRNLMASQLGCVPSQINYVLTSRFTPEQGYIIESRRGGGGYIRVRRIRHRDPVARLMHVVNTIGNGITQDTALAILQNLSHDELINPTAARVMSAALSDSAYRDLPAEYRDVLRASLFKRMLTCAI